MLGWTSLMPYQTGFSRAALKLITFDNHRDFLGNARVVAATEHSLDHRRGGRDGGGAFCRCCCRG